MCVSVCVCDMIQRQLVNIVRKFYISYLYYFDDIILPLTINVTTSETNLFLKTHFFDKLAKEK